MSAKDTDECSTPQDLFDYASEAWGPFELDACATSGNAKCIFYFLPQQDGLAQQWNADGVWCNPPYSRGEQVKWVYKAREEVRRPGGPDLVCMLLPADTSTALWHEYVWNSATSTWRDGVEGEFVQGRVKFNGAATAAKFGSVFVVFRRPVVGS